MLEWNWVRSADFFPSDREIPHGSLRHAPGRSAAEPGDLSFGSRSVKEHVLPMGHLCALAVEPAHNKIANSRKAPKSSGKISSRRPFFRKSFCANSTPGAQ